MKKFLLIILDGAAEKPETSAFAAAEKPNLDMLAANGNCGLWSGPHAPVAGRQGRHSGFNPRSMSSVATLEILGYSYKDEPGRGYLEALGIGLKPSKNALYVRGNFASVKGKKIMDRRAGRDETGLDTLVGEINGKIKSINGVRVKLHRAFGHRLVLVLTGNGLSKHVSDGDYGSNAEKIRALQPDGKKTASVLNEFTAKSSDILSRHNINKKRKLQANFILLRSPGMQQKVESFSKKFGMKACSISGVNIIRGTSMYLGIDVIDVPFSQMENDLEFRAAKAVDALEKYNFVVLHINGADTYAHDRNFNGKVKYIEKIDREVFSRIIKIRHINIAVISDHITNSKTGEHVFGHVPFLVYSPDEDSGDQHQFDEKSCERSFVTDNPMKKILSV